MCVKQRLFLPARQLANPGTALRQHSVTKHGTISRPLIIFNSGQRIKSVPRNIRQSIPQIPVRIKVLYTNLRALQNFPALVFILEIHGIHPFNFIGIVFCTFLFFRQYRDMRMIGHNDIVDDPDFFSPCTDKNVFDHSIIVLVVTAQDCTLHSLKTDMERIQQTSAAIPQGSCNNPLKCHFN